MQDFDQQLQLAQQRRQQFAGQRDFQAPQGRMVGRHFVAPNALEHLAAGLRSFNGIRGQDMAEQEMRDLQGGKQKAIADALRNFGEMSQGRPADVLPPEQAGPVRPAQAPDTMGAYQALMQAPDAALRQSGMQGIIQMPQLAAQQQERIDARDFRREEAQATRAARAEELQIKMQDARASQQERLQAQKELREMQIDAQREMRQLVASNRPERQAQIIQTESGPMQLVNGQAVPIPGADGKPVKGVNTNKALTEGQAKGSLYLGQMRSASKELNDLETAGGTKPAESAASPSSVAAAGNTWTNWATTKNAQKVGQIQNQWAEGFLRAKTGAAATTDEVALNRRTFFPVVGDSKEVIKQKAKMRKLAEDDMEFIAGPGAAKAGQHPEGSWDKPANSIDSLLDKYK